MHLVTTNTDLQKALGRLDTTTPLALDTEFMREDTYFPILCLVQVCAGDALFCVDALALERRAALANLYNGADAGVILHSAHQDLELFLQETGELPAKLFDTQIAAAMTGFDAQISYAQLVQELLGVQLDKSQTRTDWRRRPLSEAQLAYALDDVRYLAEIQPLLAEQLDARGRSDWHAQECERMLQTETYTTDPATAWRRLKGLGQLDPETRARARLLAAWRETEASERDRPRQWIIRDRLLVELARQRPTSRSELGNVDGLPESVARRYGEALIALLAEPIDPRLLAECAMDATEPLTREQRVLAKSLRACLTRCAAENEISAGLLANRMDIERLVRGAREVSVLQGWRRKVVGDQFLELLER